MHPRQPRGRFSGARARQSQALLAFVRDRGGPVHPREVDAHFAHGRVTNYWGGSSSATTHRLDLLHYHGALRIARRDAGIRLYAVREPGSGPTTKVERAARVDALIDVAVSLYGPVPRVSLWFLLGRLRYAVPQWRGELKAAMTRALTRLSKATVDGVEWFWPEGERMPRTAGEDDAVRLLAPFDPVVWDRRRFELFWGWPYRFEAYTPLAKRKLGYYALPMLWRDRMVGWTNRHPASTAGRSSSSATWTARRPATRFSSASWRPKWIAWADSSDPVGDNMATSDERELLTVDGREVVVTNPRKVLFPAAGVTKLDLVRYYLAVAEGALRGAGGRPNVLVRYPNGIDGEFFYQKRAPESRPDWIEVVSLKFPSGRTAEEVVPRDAAALVWMANLACLELHPHPVRADDLDHPDELRVDLDPVPGVEWPQIQRGGAASCAPRSRTSGSSAGRRRRARAASTSRCASSRAGPSTRCADPRWRLPARSSVARPASRPANGGRRSATASSSTTTRTPRIGPWPAPTRCGPSPTRACRRR